MLALQPWSQGSDPDGDSVSKTVADFQRAHYSFLLGPVRNHFAPAVREPSVGINFPP